MPALNIRFTEGEMEQLRAAAAIDDVSLQTFVQRAALEAASDHKRRVREGARIVAERSAEFNRSLTSIFRAALVRWIEPVLAGCEA